ncbi:MAG TPA: hypothetical protein PKI89_07225 [Tepidiformaceae bacterium]|nr:hypothetical protein [Tepidiformaceae bacterium]
MKLASLLAAVAVLPVVAAALLSRSGDDLDTARVSAEALVTAPTARTVTDERQLRIVASAIPGPDVAAGTARGTVTSVAVKPGDTLADGAMLFAVDGIDRIGFASSLPFYRAISSGVEGDDVAELHRLLVSLGLLDSLPADPDVARFATGQAVADLAEQLGAQRTTTFDPGWVVFLPAANLVAETVKLNVGQQAPAQGQVIITTPGTVTSARLISGNQEPLTFAPGVEYVAVVDGEEFSIDTAKQTIAAADLPRLRAPKETERDGISAQTRRKTPLQALAVPSSSVMTNATGTLCVWVAEGSAYRPVTVTVAGARGGVTNVASGLEPTQQVLANPAQVLENPQCP